VDTWVRTQTPFVLITWAVRHLIADVEHQEQKPFAHAFLEQQLTEYFLYAAHLLTCGFSHLEAYSNTQGIIPGVWPQFATSEIMIRQEILAAEMHEPPFFIVHRDAIGKMPPECSGLIADFWARRGFFETKQDALAAMQRLKLSMEQTRSEPPPRRYFSRRATSRAFPLGAI
jgi:hypothetical protein